MNAEEEKEERLIQWLEGNLSGEELSIFETNSEFKDYKKIIDATDDITYPKMEEDSAFEEIKRKLSSKNKAAKIIQLRRFIIAIASLFILTLAIITLLPKSINVASGVGEFVETTLPDGSKVNLNGNSKIEYQKNFISDRIIHLEGEAFFDVQKGETFAVKTDKGVITVLGTSFNIFSREDILIVSCKTGKVKVEANNQSFILQPSEGIRIKNESSEGKEYYDTTKIGSWTKGEFYFSRSTLAEVVLSLSSLYDIKINLPSQYQNKRFTGSIVHDDFNKALKMVFSPMGIQYSVDDNGNIVFSD